MFDKSIRAAALLWLASAAPLFAATTVGPWVPKFKGVDFSVSTNLPNATLPHRQVVSAFRVDLTDPDIRLLTTPRRSDYIEGSREVGGQTVSGFLENQGVQAAINSNFFDARNYYLPANYPMDLYGLAISEGVVVSPQDDAGHAAALLFDAANHATVRYTNWPPGDTTGVFTAVAGNYPLVINGKNIAKRTGNLEADPRTAFGLSQDRRYLYLIGIDGRQPGYSDGAYDYETAEWLLLLGAYDGVNMDGGGSTTLVMESSTGLPLRLNHPSAVADSNRERTVGSHLGIFAKPLPGFFNDITVIAEDSRATVSWNTTSAATSRVEFGLTEDLANSSVEDGSLVTSHVVQLAGLTPDTQYFYRVISALGSTTNRSLTYAFKTTNYVTTNFVFGITNEWKYRSGNLDGTAWVSMAYDDTSWNGPGPGLLWADSRGGNEQVQPLNTQMELNPGTGYPYITYYFRTHFNVPSPVAGSTLGLAAQVDDGLVLYLNGSEIWRLRVPDGASASTLASAYGCEGDATCIEEYVVPASALASLVAGDNVLAAEVHNYNAKSSDITFGLSVNLIQPIVRSPEITIESGDGKITIRWAGSDFRLQNAHSPVGTWEETGLSSPAVITAVEGMRFFRLIR